MEKREPGYTSMLIAEDHFIIIYKGLEYKVLLDKDDFEKFKYKNWYYRCGYASRTKTKSDKKKGKWVHLHWEVLGITELPEGMVVDHINRNKMDNRKENLRIVSHKVNVNNVSDQAKKNRSASAKIATEAAAKKDRTKKQLDSVKFNMKRCNEIGANKHIAENNHMSKKVIDSNTGKIYSCIREAAETIGMKYSTLKGKLNGNLINNTTLEILK